MRKRGLFQACVFASSKLDAYITLRAGGLTSPWTPTLRRWHLGR
ncbi:hypothetical protein [Luteitalea pratensis]|nr:hypothetical protein [Luteitalea pratensis]